LVFLSEAKYDDIEGNVTLAWTTLKQMCISVVGFKLWNYLPNDLKGCVNIIS